MLIIERPDLLPQAVGQVAGPSEWLTVDQKMIDAFAALTGDHQWVHVDVERAAREMSGGKTIAHGFLTLSLIPGMLPQLMQVKGTSRSLNYGSDRMRFLSPVPVDSKVRGRLLLKAVTPAQGGQRAVIEVTVEVDGQDKPALVAELIAFHAD